MRYRKHLPTAAAAAFALAFAGGVAAQAPSFEELDTDANGLISRSEAAAAPCLANNFDAIEKADPAGLNSEEFNQAVSEYCSG